MAQGIGKKPRTTAVKPAVAKRLNRKITSQAAKSLKPKKHNAISQASFARKHTAALTSATEKLISSRVGHLEMLEGTRREIENEKKAKDQKLKQK